MSMPFYVAPEQQMKDRADFARKGIARGRSVVVLHYADGIVFVAENRSQALHKVSEIYDRIGFAAVGRYNEFENLRTAGIRYADLRGYSYDRTDVTGRGLANAYAQLLGTIFSSGGEKPYEVEIVVAELGATAEQDQIYRLTYDGSVADEENFAVMGGSADVIAEAIGRASSRSSSLAAAVRLAVRALELRRRAERGRRASSGRRARGGHPGPDPRAAAQVPPDHRRPAGGAAARRRRAGRPRPGGPARSCRRSRPCRRPTGRREPVTVGLHPRLAAPAARRRGRRRRADRGLDRLRPDRGRLARCTCRTGRSATPGWRPGSGAGTVEPAEPGRGRPGRRRGAARTRSPDVVAESLEAYPRATVTDVGSVKAGVLDALWRRARRPDPLRRLAPDGRLAALRAGDGPGRPVPRPHLGGHPAPPLGPGRGGPGRRRRSGPAAPGRW